MNLVYEAGPIAPPPKKGGCRVGVWILSVRPLLERLHALSTERRGTGTNTAIAAAALAWDQRSQSAECVILKAANAIGSDTDTIATMAGALVGAIAKAAPHWPVQDVDYIVMEAKRMAQISRREPATTFRYPDLIGWQAPASQSDAVGFFNGKLALSGFGALDPIGKAWRQGEFAWQWFKTTFGQTVLCKIRAEIRTEIGQHLMPQSRPMQTPQLKPVSMSGRSTSSERAPSSLPLFEESTRNERPGPAEPRSTQPINVTADRSVRTLDDLTEIAIQSNFDAQIVGECLLECSSGPDGIEKSVSFAAIIAKAVVVRKRRMSK